LYLPLEAYKAILILFSVAVPGVAEIHLPLSCVSGGGAMARKVFFIMLSAVLLSSACIAGEVNVKKIAKSDWINIETANFNVFTNAKEKNALAIVEELERFENGSDNRYIVATESTEITA